MLNQLQGASGSGASAKQGGDEEQNLTKAYDRKDNEASGSRKDKGTGVSKEENDKNPILSESERIAREKRDKEINELNALQKKLGAEEAEAKNSKLILET